MTFRPGAVRARCGVRKALDEFQIGTVREEMLGTERQACGKLSNGSIA
jgi:hypothetical protein